MKAPSLSIAIASLAALLAPAGSPRAATLAPTVGGSSAHYVPGEVLVKFKPSVAAGARRAAVASQGHALVATLSQPGWVHVRLPAGQSVDRAIAAYARDPRVELAQPNFVYRIAAAPNDPQYGQLWAARNTGQTIVNGFTQPPASPLGYTTDNPGTAGDDMNLEKAWDHVTDCSAVVVAVVDSGVNYNHEDLAGNMWNGGATYPLHGYNYVDGNNNPMDKNGHGTHVAGIIGAMGNNAKGATGVCWKASIMAVRVLDAAGRGTTANIIQGIDFAVANGAKVINMSLGGGGAFDTLYSNVITVAQTADVVVVVAAGNDGSNNDDPTTPVYPCDFNQPNLVCVAALDQSYQLASFSNYGSTSVDVGAPGTNILSTWAGTGGLVTDALNSGWNANNTVGWANSTLALTSGSVNVLVDPSTYPTGTYANNADDRAWKSFTVSGVDVTVLHFAAGINVLNGDHFRVAYSTTGLDPFSGGTVVADATNLATWPKLPAVAVDVSGCIGASCTIGFQLTSGAATPTDKGVGIARFAIETLALNSTSYNTINGTSMATPEVAGLAALLRAYNPQYTYADVVASIENGGRPTPALAGKTTSGNAVDAMGSLAHINPPTGLAAQVR